MSKIKYFSTDEIATFFKALKKGRDVRDLLFFSFIYRYGLRLNEAFGTKFNDDDKVFLGRIKDNLLRNKELVNKMEHNSKQNVKAVFDKYFNQEMIVLLNSNMKFYKRIVDNEKLKKQLKSALFELLYFEFNKMKKKSSKETTASP